MPLAAAKSITRSEWLKDPRGEAARAVDQEWTSLQDVGVWDMSSVTCWNKVAYKARCENRKLHLGSLFDLCVLKGSELPPGAKGRRHKGRVVFQGNRVTDEQRDHALVQDLGSSPSTMEAAKAANLVGCADGSDEEISDADMAYTQADCPADAIQTYVALPREMATELG